jgi:hypothetical protein
MIVIAILGIVLETFYQPARTFLGLNEKAALTLRESENLTRAFTKMKQFHANRNRIRAVKNNQIRFADGSVIFLSDKGKTILLHDNNGAVKLNNIRFALPAKQIDACTYVIKMRIADETLLTHWRCGE